MPACMVGIWFTSCLLILVPVCCCWPKTSCCCWFIIVGGTADCVMPFVVAFKRAFRPFVFNGSIGDVGWKYFGSSDRVDCWVALSVRVTVVVGCALVVIVLTVPFWFRADVTVYGLGCCSMRRLHSLLLPADPLKFLVAELLRIMPTELLALLLLLLLFELKQFCDICSVLLLVVVMLRGVIVACCCCTDDEPFAKAPNGLNWSITCPGVPPFIIGLFVLPLTLSSVSCLFNQLITLS